jgi:hypothetical protein
MSGAIHISGEEAAKDFAAVLNRARASESVVVVWRDGSETLIRHRPSAGVPKRRTIAEAIEVLRVRQETQRLAVPDSDFASDMEEIHELYNEPMDVSKWD